MSRLGYRLIRTVGCFCWVQSVRLKVIRREAPERQGPYILAMTHVSHLDPILLSIIVRRRQIHWITRIEFFRTRLRTWLLLWWNTIPVRRFGVPVSTIRTSIARLREGHLIGVCPEGGVAQGASSMMRGAPLKKGVCLISYRTGVPVLPCIMLGSEKLNCVKPWLPFKRARLWVAFGSRLVYPQTDNPDRRAARQAMAQELSQEYQALYAEALREFQLTDAALP